MRLLCGVMRQASAASSLCEACRNCSDSGPGSTRRVVGSPGASPPSGARTPNGLRRRCASSRRDVPMGRRSPLRRARPSSPPKPAFRSVLREPSIGATSMPPATASQLRRPGRAPVAAPPSRRVWPACTGTLQQDARAWPASVAPKASPVSAMRVSCSKRISQPPIVSSSPAAESALPTSRLASASASVSSAPPGQMPSCRWP